MKNIIILGSGRSGTSMVASSLAKSWYNFGRNSNSLKENNNYQFQILQDSGTWPSFQVSINYNVI